MDERRDFIEVLVQDHSEADNTFLEIDRLLSEQSQESITTAGELSQQVITELVKHSVAEEEYVYPLVRQKLPNGDEVADMEIGEHAQAEETMKQLDGISPSNVEFKATVSKLAMQVREHAGKEEAELLPALGGKLSQEERLELGQKIEKAKAMAPTHPHPAAPDRPPMNKVMGPGVALVDRIRDALTGHKK